MKVKTNLAMNAILAVDHKPPAQSVFLSASLGDIYILIHASRTGFVQQACIVAVRDFGVARVVAVRNDQMAWSVFRMHGARSRYAGEDVEAELAVWVGVFDRGALFGQLRLC